MDRKDKINSLKAILSGTKKPEDLVEEKHYVLHKGIDEPYRCQGMEMTEEEYQAWLKTLHTKDHVIILKEQEGNDPLIDE